MSTPIPGESTAPESTPAPLAAFVGEPLSPDQTTVDVLSIGVFLAVALVTFFAAVEAYQFNVLAAQNLALLGFGALLSGLPWGTRSTVKG